MSGRAGGSGTSSGSGGVGIDCRAPLLLPSREASDLALSADIIRASSALVSS
jgi:hypothetical protein